MTCVICKTGTTAPGTATATFNSTRTTVVIKNVPADVCGRCGEAYYDAATTRRLLEMANAAKAAGVELELREYVLAPVGDL
jgi:YgiT-type zinc finger domain-containing protein